MNDLSIPSVTTGTAGTLSSPSTASPSTASDAEAEKIAGEIDALTDKIAATRQSLRESSPNQTVFEFQKETRDVFFDNQATARDIGVLVKDKSRLNVISSLAVGDSVDAFRFRATNSGKLTIGSLGDEQVRIQVLSRFGVVMLDSDEEAGAAHEAYLQAKEGGVDFKADQYIVRVSRSEQGPGETGINRNYGVQLRMGDYSEDYDTVEREASGSALDQFRSPQTDELTAMLSEGMSTISSMSYGLPATSKLLGVMVSGLV